MADEEIKSILQDYRTVASVGLSADETKDSFAVGAYLQRAGYHIIPVNPKADHILGHKVYRSLIEIPEKAEIVQVFRPANEALGIVEQAIAIGARVVWMQLGIANEEAAVKARAAGLRVVMDHCMMQEHRRLLAELDTL
jgi:predicted CoA-binding protein